MEMILLDTNILIEILKDNRKTIEQVQSLNKTLAISSITVMELYYGARDKAEVNKLEKFVSLLEIIHPNEAISSRAIQLIKTYAKSHALDIPGGLIAATALVSKAALLTYNTKDFKYIKGLELV